MIFVIAKFKTQLTLSKGRFCGFAAARSDWCETIVQNIDVNRKYIFRLLEI